MKKTFLFAVLVAAFSSCNKVDIKLPPTPPSTIKINDKDLKQTLNAKAGEKDISVSSNYKWQYELDEYVTWLKATPYTTDNILTLLTTSNRSYRSRSAEVRVFNNTDSKTIEVTQSGTTEYIPASATSIRPPTVFGLSGTVERGEDTYGNSIVLSCDGDPGTYFYTKFDEADYTRIKYVVNSSTAGKYICFTPPDQIKDRPFSRLKLSYKKLGSSEIVEYLDTTLVQGCNAPFIVNYPPNRFMEFTCDLYTTEINGEHIAALAELSILSEMPQANYYAPFTDATCTKLVDGTTAQKIDNIKNEIYMANLAHYVLLNKYPTTRLRNFAATVPQLTAQENGPNATELYFKDKEKHAILVGDRHGKNISLRIFNKTNNTSNSYPLHEGCNIIQLAENQGGYGYIRYEKTDDSEYPDIFVNLTSGDEELGW